MITIRPGFFFEVKFPLGQVLATPGALEALEQSGETPAMFIKRHIGGEHDLTPDHYRAKWGLPPTYPMVASEYTAQRSQLSKDRWLGRKPPPAPPPKNKRERPARGK